MTTTGPAGPTRLAGENVSDGSPTSFASFAWLILPCAPDKRYKGERFALGEFTTGHFESVCYYHPNLYKSNSCLTTKRAIEEGLNEDGIALFDLLKKDDLAKAERERVKQADRTPASARTRHVAPVAVGSPGRSPETGPPTGSGPVYVDHRQLGNVGDAPDRVVVDVHPSRAAVAEPVAG